MASSEAFVVVGGGLAGGKAVEALRGQGFDGRLVLIAEEAHLPYERPPLSKDYLNGSAERDTVFVHPREWYLEHDVDLRLGTPARSIDRDAHRVLLEGGDSVGYTKLLLVTGARPRILALPGADAANVHYLRTLEDSDRLRELFANARRLVVIGAGWIGLEATAAARKAGVDVTVVESAALPLLRVLGAEVAQVFAGLHVEHGVDLRFGASLTAVTTDGGRATGVELADGSTIAADAVLVGVGAQPNVELAAAAALDVDDGVVVGADLRSSDPDVFAAGDVAKAMHPTLGRHIRVEHWANALKQPATAASSMLGVEAAYDELPYFYSDQYDLGMEYVGYVEPGGYDDVVFRGDRDKREFVAFWTAGGRVLAGMNVNVWDVVEPIKAIIRSGRVIDPTRLADPEIPLDAI